MIPAPLENCFVISIRQKRLEDFFQQDLGPLREHFSVVTGVNGSQLDRNALAAVYKPINQWNVLTRGEIGCFLSHLGIWKQMCELKLPYAFIVEDDCQVPPLADLQRALQEVNSVDPTWKVFLLGRNPRFKQDAKRVTAHLSIPRRSWGLFCYFITLEGARHLVAKGHPIRAAVDVFVSSCKMRGKYALIRDLAHVRSVKSDTVNIR
uniref:Glycosyl transferase family 25 domain-containing protein n=1 Tax=viral metagenome TaxID=1070528 RepID=A0A6C0BPN7_9ZZZZ